jgi:hypothetical protein
MADSAGARRAFVISVILAAIVLGPALAVATTGSRPTGPCQTLYGAGAYCVGTVTISFWCPAPSPCPADGERIHIQGYTFGFFGFVWMTNDTAGLNVGIRASNNSSGSPQYSFTFWSNPMGWSESWFSPDHLFFVSWPDVPAHPRLPMTLYVVCGVAAPSAGG